jgi:hypothetical protein
MLTWRHLALVRRDLEQIVSLGHFPDVTQLHSCGFGEWRKPFFCFPSEEEIAAQVKCSLHGNRFRQPIFHIYVAKWRREGEPRRRQRLSSQYQKAWSASLREDLVGNARPITLRG